MVVDQWFGGRALQGQRVVWVRRCYWVMWRPEPCSSRRSRMRRCFRRVLFIRCFVGCCQCPGPFAPSMPPTLWVELVRLAAVTSLFGASIPASEHRSPPWERRARCCFATCSVRLGMLHFSCISVCRPFLGRCAYGAYRALPDGEEAPSGLRLMCGKCGSRCVARSLLASVHLRARIAI